MPFHLVYIEDSRLLDDETVELIGALPFVRSIVEPEKMLPAVQLQVLFGQSHELRQRNLMLQQELVRDQREPVEPGQPAQSISADPTFERVVSDPSLDTIAGDSFLETTAIAKKWIGSSQT